jgi:hypothetical protein
MPRNDHVGKATRTPHAIPNTILQLIAAVALRLGHPSSLSSWAIVADAARGIECPGNDK